MKKRITAIAVGAGLLFSGLFGILGTPAYAATGSALLKSVVTYNLDYSTGKWKKTQKTNYKYKKAYPVAINSYDYGTEEWTKNTLTYTFKKNLPVKMTKHTFESEIEHTVTYNENGQIDKSISRIPLAKTSDMSIYVYGNKNYFTSVFHESIYPTGSGKNSKYSFREESDTVAVTAKNGLLKKTVNRGIYANWDDPEKVEWLRFNGTYTANYDADGIIKSTSAKFRVGPESGKQHLIKLTKKDGRVTKAVRYRWNRDTGKWEKDRMVAFSYTNIPVSKARYASMINDQIMEGGGNYYIYNWY